MLSKLLLYRPGANELKVKDAPRLAVAIPMLYWPCSFMMGELWASGQLGRLLQEFHKTTDDGGYTGRSLIIKANLGGMI